MRIEMKYVTRESADVSASAEASLIGTGLDVTAGVDVAGARTEDK